VTRLGRVTLLVAVALVAADSAIVVLALPQLLIRFGQTIPDTAWVVTSYNLAAAIAGAVVVVAAHRIHTRPVLIGGLALFSAATIGCAVSTSLSMLIALRAAQGVGGALTLAGALAELGAAWWAGAAAIGAAAGPALGGALTEIFDWRAIFVAQAPVAIGALVASFGVASIPLSARGLGRPSSNVALALISGALVGALFLAVVLLVEAHGLSPLRAAAVVTLLPAAALLVRALAPRLPVEAGVLVLAGGLALLALAPGSLPVVALGLAACGTGLGICLPPTTEESRLAGVASRHAGVVLGLLLLAPILSDDVNHNADVAKTDGIVLVVKAPVPFLDKIPLTIDLYRELRKAGHGRLPDFTSAFDKARRRDEDAAAKLTALQQALEDAQQDAIARAFKRPFAVAAILALVALVPLAGRRLAPRLRQAVA
jgi:MFS family permease